MSTGSHAPRPPCSACETRGWLFRFCFEEANLHSEIVYCSIIVKITVTITSTTTTTIPITIIVTTATNIVGAAIPLPTTIATTTKIDSRVNVISMAITL